jgi:hypothetical protein
MLGEAALAAKKKTGARPDSFAQIGAKLHVFSACTLAAVTQVKSQNAKVKMQK